MLFYAFDRIKIGSNLSFKNLMLKHSVNNQDIPNYIRNCWKSQYTTKQIIYCNIIQDFMQQKTYKEKDSPC
jgi:hypothetical protein